MLSVRHCRALSILYFDDKDKTEKEKQTSQSITIHNFTATGSNVNLGTLSHSTMMAKNTISFIEKEIEEKGGEDKEELRNLLEDIKELCDIWSHCSINWYCYNASNDRKMKTILKFSISIQKESDYVLRHSY